MISFIITTHNHLHCIDNAISTIVNNIDILDYWYDIVIVDNNSTDGTYDYCIKNYDSNNRISIYQTTENNYAKARDIGIKNSKNDKICFIDGDDYLNTIMLQDIFNTVRISNYELYMIPYVFEEVENLFNIECMNYNKGNIFNNEDLFNLVMTNGIDMFKIPSFIVDKKFLEKNSIVFTNNVEFCINVYDMAKSIFYIENIDWWYYKTKNTIYGKEEQVKYIEEIYNTIKSLKDSRYEELCSNNLTLGKLFKYGK